jgi:ParB family chromosome partitioning protein
MAKAKKKTTTKPDKKKSIEVIRSAPLERMAISKILVEDNVRDPGWETNLDDLKSNIQQFGLQQPVKVQALLSEDAEGHTHRLVFGFRRLECCKRLGWTVIPVVNAAMRETERDRYMSAVMENTARASYTPIEEARIFKKMSEKYGMPAKDIAAAWAIDGKPATTGFISQRLSLLKMPEPVQEAVQDGAITPTHARELNRIKDPQDQKKLLKKAEKMSPSEFKEAVAELAPEKKKKTDGRGRPTKPAKKTASDGSPAKVRPKRELVAAMGRLDKQHRAVKASGKKEDERYLAGLLRGLGYAAGLVKELPELK